MNFRGGFLQQKGRGQEHNENGGFWEDHVEIFLINASFGACIYTLSAVVEKTAAA